MFLSRLVFLVFFVCAVGVQPAMAAGKTSPDEASKFLQVLGDQAVDLLGDGSLPLSEREEKIRNLLRKNFDLKTIGRFVLSKAWRTTPAEQREEYLGLFSEFVVRTYARRLGGYAGERFKITSAKPLGRRDALVVTQIKRQAGPVLSAGWRVRKKENGHKIIDVMVEGVSMAAAQRSEFESIVRKQGVGGLIEILRAKVSTFSAKSS